MNKSLLMITVVCVVLTAFCGCFDKGVRQTPVTGSGHNMDGTETTTSE